ncbi:bifunctional adenosylcobinamide kinase/adenosylcobinamide-phosphate guanylyltransferase [Streptosporangium sandarakinum]
MKVLITGTARGGGWPVPGCGCASCARLSPGHRRPTEVVVTEASVPLTGSAAGVPSHVPAPGSASGTAPGPVLGAAGAVRLPLAAGDPPPPGHRVSATADGLVLVTPGGGRVLDTTASPSAPVSGPPAAPDGGRGDACDLVLMDVLDRPERLGDMRRRGVVDERTRVVAVDVDHRVPTEAELARRAALWGVLAVPDGTVLDLAGPAPARVPRPPRTLLLGGARSGKSAEAELRLAAEPEVLYVATGPSGDGDAEWARRVRAHRDRRPAHWGTAETIDLAGLLRTPGPPLLVDGLGTWVAAVFDENGAWPGDPENPDRTNGENGPDGPDDPDRARDEDHTAGTDGARDGDHDEDRMAGASGARNGDHDEDRMAGASGVGGLEAVSARCDELVAAWRETRRRVVAVSDETGLGVVPATAGGRMFRDVLGRLNQRLALESEEVALVVAGRLLPLPV